MSSELYLSITPLKISEIPAEDAIIKAGRELLDSTSTWKQGKAYQHNKVKTFHRAKGPKDGTAWYGRVSEHPKEEGTFADFWRMLGEDKAENEKKYIPDIQKVQLIKRISPTQSVWTLFYHLTPPISPRVFTVVQTTWLSESSPKTGIIVSMPVDVTGEEEYAKLEEKGVKGRYVAVERIMERDDGTLEWRMATSSTPGGSIPQFVADSSMASTISRDVTWFVEYLAKNRASGAAPAATTEVHVEVETAPNAAAAEASGAGAGGAAA